MKHSESFGRTERIVYSSGSPPGVKTAAREIKKVLAPGAEVEESDGDGINARVAGTVHVSAGSVRDAGVPAAEVSGLEQVKGPFVHARIGRDGSGIVAASDPCHLFGFVHNMADRLCTEDAEAFEIGRTITPAFAWQRISYDYFLNQGGRIQKGFDAAVYIRELARLGFTHVEVNGLAFPAPLETGPAGETYPMFYTYCPALDQFVSSSLNQGLYPEKYLAANLNRLKLNAAVAVEHGLVPGLLCFEPRSVPEEFFERYPMLRGARVDHPFRSFKPRYNMTITHPRVREHYAEMVDKLMREVPGLGFLCIWTNDSGAGFEHTKSLYVGRNGGAYLIREWKDDNEIARCAGENALRLLRVLRDAGRGSNPEFRVLTRLESFYGEHDTVWAGLGDAVDVETASLIARGWDAPYPHPRYSDRSDVNAGTVYQGRFSREEKQRIEEIGARGALSHYYFTAGPHNLFDPLLGVPYPALAVEKLKMLRAGGVQHLAHAGGSFSPELVPYNVNHEMVRAYQFDADLDIGQEIERLARKWAGDALCGTLCRAWAKIEDAILAFPVIAPLYSTFGFTWYRLWVRPLVPDIEAIPQEERAYYEEFMCTTPHNTNNVDLSRDVLFRLAEPAKCRIDVERIDENLWGPLDEAVELLKNAEPEAADNLATGNVIEDQLVRARALRCWFMTQRNVAAWIACVHGYIDVESGPERKKLSSELATMIEKEIDNTHELIELTKSPVEFMALTDQGETPLIHGTNLCELLEKRIKLMKRHMHDEPRIDPDYVERRSGGG